MANISLWLDNRRAKNDGSFPVKVYINHKKRFYISTNINCREDNWINGELGKREENYKTKNSRLRNIVSTVDRVITSLELNGSLKTMSDARLKEIITSELFNIKRGSYYIVDYLKAYMPTKNSDSSKRIYTAMMLYVEEFDSTATLDNINSIWIEDFIIFLKNRVSINTIARYIAAFKTAFNSAINKGLTQNYPFRVLKIKKERTRKRNIGIELLRDFFTADISEKDQEYRDYFFLIFYLRGINTVDLFNLKHSDMKGGYISYKRRKTGANYLIKVEPEALDLINKYKGVNYLLRVQDNNIINSYTSKMNLHLKKMKKIGAKEPMMDFLTTYWARHTWATLASSIGISKDVIAAGLGHSSNSITDIYIEYDQHRIDRANRRLIDYLKGDWLPSDDII
ncbi:phage integrase SAM-like domain-containing protein [uncultured Bacteroides sp.]|uniref:phage integrase SAM-like domain-containing protein n=1 Tax=uncultured Bacteroides sp. TaxID=162156 RepID=UPI00262715AF|nr:phage integrase SAM-like domain-containing protein [uncultured Bacteroides sp.]